MEEGCLNSFISLQTYTRTRRVSRHTGPRLSAPLYTNTHSRNTRAARVGGPLTRTRATPQRQVPEVHARVPRGRSPCPRAACGPPSSRPTRQESVPAGRTRPSSRPTRQESVDAGRKRPAIAPSHAAGAPGSRGEVPCGRCPVRGSVPARGADRKRPAPRAGTLPYAGRKRPAFPPYSCAPP